MNNLNDIKKSLLFYFLVLFIFSLILFYSINRLLPKIKNNISAVNVSNQNQKLLNDKIELLKKIDQNLLSNPDKLIQALPKENKVLFAISNIKSKAQEYEVILDKYKMNGSSAKEELQKETVSFKGISKDLKSFLIFTKYITNTSPILTIDNLSVKISENLSFEADVSLYYSQLPTEIPPIISPITNLTQDEIVLFEKIYSLEDSNGLQIEALPPSERENPFL